VLSRFTPLEEIEKALCPRIASVNLTVLADQAARAVLDRLRGRA
jgi:hypothetical protein